MCWLVRRFVATLSFWACLFPDIVLKSHLSLHLDCDGWMTVLHLLSFYSSHDGLSFLWQIPRFIYSLTLYPR